MVKIACQTIVFGNPKIKDNLGAIDETVKKSGYDGIEIGVRHFYQDRLEYYKELFANLGLNLMALHVGGDFLNKDSVKDQLENMKNTIVFGKKLGCTYIFLSGKFKEGKTADEFATEAESYAEIGKTCNGEGLKFCYHNHDWEFYKPVEGMKILLDKVPPGLMSLVPDVGWLEQAGVNALQFLKDNISRVEALHFKEYKRVGVTPREAIIKEVAELGKGIVPFREIYDYVTGLGRDWWIVAEQDETQLDPNEAARINCEYIKGLGK
jgi:sugar phosphate isomerase/epimerase